MPDEHQDDPVGDEVQWYRDPDGTEWFVDDGVRFELADDGFAYPVVGGSTDPSDAEPLEVVVDEEALAQGDTAVPERDAGDPPPAVEPAAIDDADPDDTANGAATDDDTGEDEPVSPFAPDAAPDATTRIRTIRVQDTADEDDAAPWTDEEVASASTTPAQRQAERDRAEPLLRVQGLDGGYGSLPVLKGVELEVHQGQTAVLLGLNGAGKTTTVSTVAGALQPWAGQIVYDGEDVAGWSTSKAVANGVVMVPEGRRVFPDLSVHKNLLVGAWGKRRDDEWFDAQREIVFDYFPRLRERETQLAGTLSGGEQQMLAVGRGLMAGPRLLIIDEASMGLAPVIVQDVFDIVAQINQDGVTVLMVEQNVAVLEVADIGYVMEQGRVVRILEGEELTDRSVVSEALMG